MELEGDHINQYILRLLWELQEEFKPVEYLVLSFVGKRAAAQRRAEFETAVSHARSLGINFDGITIVHEKLGRHGKADALCELGVHVLIDDQSAIVREAQKTGATAFRNYTTAGLQGLYTTVENIRQYLSSRPRHALQVARPLDPSDYLEEINRSSSQLPRRGLLR